VTDTLKRVTNAAMTHGTCVRCLRTFTIKKDGTLRDHKGAGYKPTQCTGAGEHPLETIPLTSETLSTVVRAASRQARLLYRGEDQKDTFVALELIKLFGPRLRQLEAENAMLVDTVASAAALWFGEVDSPSERDAASENLHLTAEELKVRYPRLRGER
jgi:hypothetical protein